MKELYTSPEMKIVCFAPVEKLAADKGLIDFGDLLNLEGPIRVGTNAAIESVNDLEVNAIYDEEQ